MKKFVLALLSSCGCAAFVLAQDPILLKGKIGMYAVIAELNIYDDTTASIRYFYESKRKDIELEGTIGRDGRITAICYNNFDEKFDSRSEKLDLKKIKNGYSGTWNTRQKILPVNLYFLSVDSIKNRFSNYTYIQKLKTESPFEYVRTAGLQFFKDSATKMNGYDLDWYHEKYSGIQLFRLRKQAMTDAIRKINEQLQEAQVEKSNDALGCTSSRTATEFNQDINHIFLSNEVLSVNIFTDYYCGGAHPDFGSTSLNFDLSTGAPIKLDDVLWFGKANTLAEDSHEWYNYRESIFAPKVVSLLQQLYPQQMKSTDTDDECDYVNPDVWTFPNWYFTDKGVYLGAIFGRAARSCDEPSWSVIPYGIVKQYLHPSLKLKLP